MAVATVTAIAAGIAAAALGAWPAHSSEGGSLVTEPVAATLHPIVADGSTSGQLSGLIDLPQILGDEGDYSLEGLAAPVPDDAGNGEVAHELPAGSIPGVITDPEDGTVDDEPGRGLSIAGGSESVVRNPAGISATTQVDSFVIDVNELNETVGTVLGRGEIVRVDSVTTETAALIDGSITAATSIAGLQLLGEDIPLTDGHLDGAASRSTVVTNNDVVALLQSLGIDQDDIDSYKGLISSSSLDATLTVTASMADGGGLALEVHLDIRIRASVILGLGSADIRSNAVVLDAVVAGAGNISTPTPMAPRDATLAVQEGEPGDTVTIMGIGFAEGFTTVSIGGTNIEAAVTADGRSLEFIVPEGLAARDYAVTVSTPGGEDAAGNFIVLGDDTVPVTVGGVLPGVTHDGATVTVNGSGFVAGETEITVTDADDAQFRVPASAVSVAESGLDLQFRLPEGLALGEALIEVAVGEQTGAVGITIIPLTLPPVPSTGSAAVTGVSAATQAVRLTEDNSSVVTWSNPRINNPTGTTGTSTQLQVGMPSLNENGLGTVSDSGAGITGTVTREPGALIATASASNYGLTLPSPWTSLYGSPIVTASSMQVTSQAGTDGTASNSVALSGVQVLGNAVSLNNGQVAGRQEFTVRYDRNALRGNHSILNGSFWSDAREGYDRMESASFLQVWVAIEPVAATASGGSASAAAFKVSVDVQFRYEGENGGWLSTRARHGTGDSREGRRVNMYTATVGATQVSAPQAIAPAVTGVDPALANPGDTVTVDGRGFTGDSILLYGDTEITPQSVNSTGTQLTFTVPGDAEPGPVVVTVRTAAGTSTTDRTVTVMGAPNVTENPASVTTSSTDPVVFTASAEGHPAPTAQWQRLQGETWADLDGETGDTLTVDPTPEDDGAQFRAVYRNAVGEVTTDAATLTVEYAPTIVEQTGAAGPVPAGDALTFAVSIQAKPAATVVWQIDRGDGWADIQTDATDASAITSALDYTVAPEDNGARIRAVVSNAHGTVESDPVEIEVRYAPTVTEQPASVTTSPSEPVEFTAAAVGNPAPAAQWQRLEGDSWVDLEGETGDTLTVDPSAEDNGAQFRVVYANELGEVESDPATLTVEYAPTIVQQPTAPGPVAAGDVLRLEVTVEANPAATVAWYINRGNGWTEIESEAPAADAGTSVLEYTVAPADDGTQIRAEVTNANGSVASDAVDVVVHYAPTVTEQPASVTTSPSEPVEFTAAAVANPAPAAQWQRLEGDTWVDLEGETGDTLTVDPSAMDNGAQFRVVYANELGGVESDAATLTVEYSPSIMQQPSAPGPVTAGDQVTLGIEVDANPSATVQWQIDRGDGWGDLETEGVTAAAAGTSELRYTVTPDDDGASIRAIVTNAHGSVESDVVALDVHYAPIITTAPRDAAAEEGETVTLTAAAQSNPAYTVRWEWRADADADWTPVEGGTGEQLELTAQFSENGAQYRAVFVNEVGETATDPVTITVTEVPAPEPTGGPEPTDGSGATPTPAPTNGTDATDSGANGSGSANSAGDGGESELESTDGTDATAGYLFGALLLGAGALLAMMARRQVKARGE